MNKVILIGNLVKDPEARYTGDDAKKCVVRFSIAVQRAYKKEGQPSADFVNCIAVDKTAEFIEKYFHKGMKIGIVGKMQTGSYEKDGKKVFTCDVFCETVEFVEGKKDSKEEQTNAGFINIPEGADDEGLPFN